MSFDLTVNFKSALALNNNNNVNSRLLWSKATEYDISNYVNILNDNLNSIGISEDLFSCDNCNSIEHRNAIDNLCDSVITSCINCIPTTRSLATNVTGWTDHVKPERERSLLWHWIWLDSGKPNKGFLYEIMK